MKNNAKCIIIKVKKVPKEQQTAYRKKLNPVAVE